MSANLRKSLLLVPALLGATVVASPASAQSAEKSAEVQTALKPEQTQVVELAPQAAPTAPTAVAPEAPMLVASTPAAPVEASATPGVSTLSQVQSYGSEGRGAGSSDQVTSVSQLTDVRPTDWAFQALQSLVERYGCIVGYPDRTYRGNQALTRFEFAAGLNACLDRVSELIAAATTDFVRKEDLDILRRLQEEFAAELATLRGRVDALEARTATLERQQFSTTTKLSGEVIFSVADTFGDFADDDEDTDGDDPTQTVFQNRVRLALDSSFTGRDRLRTRLEAKNALEFNNSRTGTNMTRLSYDGGQNNSVIVDKLYYRFPLGDNIRIQIDAINNEFYDGYITANSALESSGLGALSRFGRFNPILRVNSPGTSGSAGLTAAFNFNQNFRIEGGVSAGSGSNDPSEKNGLFNGAVTGIGQIVFDSGALTIAGTYAYNYAPGGNVNITGSTGSSFAAAPFADPVTGVTRATRSHSFGGSVQFKLSPQFIIGGWGALQLAYDVNNDDEATVVNGAVYLAAPDLFKRGNLGAILVGLPPKITDNDQRRRRDNDTSFHIEGLYRFRINDNIALTPGLFVIINPDHNEENDTQFVGVLRATFTF
jgi:hypothetical protein